MKVEMKKMVTRYVRLFGSGFLRLLVLGVLTVVLLSGCQRDELCYLHPNRARVELLVDWGYARLNPNSATAVVYRADGTRLQTVSMENPRRQVLDLPVGNYSIVLFNESMEPDADHAATLGFRNLDRFDAFEVYAKDDYATRSTRSIRVNPDTLAVARVVDLLISEEMVNKLHLSSTARDEIALYPVDTVIRVLPKRVFSVTNLLINIKNFNGYIFSTLYPPTLHGMAESYFLATGLYSIHPVKHVVRLVPARRSGLSDVTTFTASFTVIGLLDDLPPNLSERPDYRLELRLLHPGGVVIKDIDLTSEAQLIVTREPDHVHPHDYIDIEINVELDELVGVGDGMGGSLEDWEDQDVPLDGPPLLWFHPNGGDGAIHSWRYPVATVLTLPACSFAPPPPPASLDLRFVEWNSRNDGTGTSYRPGNTLSMPPGGTTLFAIWK